MANYSHEKILELYDTGMPQAEIAKIVGCAESRISQIVREYGRSAFHRRYPEIHKLDNTQLIEDYRSGMPHDKILEKHHIGSSTLYRRLRKMKIPHRPRLETTGPRNPQYKHGKGCRRNEREPSLTKQVVAICLGHIVPRGWQIHHMDENPGNNHPENLLVFRSKSGHAIFHQRQLKLQREGLPVDAIQLASETDGFSLPLPTHPILLPHEKGRLDPSESSERQKLTPEEYAQSLVRPIQQLGLPQ